MSRQTLSFRFQCGNLLNEHQPLFWGFFSAWQAGTWHLLMNFNKAASGAMSFFIPAKEYTPKAVVFGCCCVCCRLLNLCAPEFLLLGNAGVERDDNRETPVTTSEIGIFYLFINHELLSTCQSSRPRTLHHTIRFCFLYHAPFPLPDCALLGFYKAEQCWNPCPPLSFGKRTICAAFSSIFALCIPTPPPLPIRCSFRGAFRGAFPLPL